MRDLSLLHRLKSATAAHHARVEAAMPPLEALATRQGYAAALRALHGFHAAWEPAIWACEEVRAAGFSRREREKLPLLRRDLAALGVVPLGGCPRPALRGSEGLGALYVLEGASLGGQIIRRRTAGPLGVGPEDGGAYYHGYGAATGERWREFTTGLARHAARPADEAQVVEGAVACFAALEGWLATPGVLPGPVARV